MDVEHEEAKGRERVLMASKHWPKGCLQSHIVRDKQGVVPRHCSCLKAKNMIDDYITIACFLARPNDDRNDKDQPHHHHHHQHTNKQRSLPIFPWYNLPGHHVYHILYSAAAAAAV